MAWVAIWRAFPQTQKLGFLMISPYLLDFCPVFLLLFSPLETADFLMLFKPLGFGYSLLCSQKQLPRHTPAQDLLILKNAAFGVVCGCKYSFVILHKFDTHPLYGALCTRTPNPLSPQKGSLVNLSDALYATSTMDLRSRYIKKFARVPLHLNYKLLDIDSHTELG